jgi:pyruvate formate lyase activating enzyme
VTVFFKGCPLECWWCHNPEGISSEAESVERVDRIGEKEFIKVETVGHEYGVEDIMKILEKEKIFMEESGGGVTFSGGEPLMQIEFLEEALVACKENSIHTAVDTSGYITGNRLDRILPLTDLFLLDLKHLDPLMHKKYTGVSNEQILSNYNKVLEMGKEVIFRFPVIPGYNDDKPHLNELKEYFMSHSGSNLKRIDLLPFHKIGSSKYKRFNLEYRMSDIKQPSDSRMDKLKSFFSDTGLPVKVGG